MPLSKSPLRRFFEQKRPQDGNRRTPNVAIFFYHKGAYLPTGGPIMRMIVDMADESKILASLDTGIDQRPGGPHSTDFMDLFHSGLYVEMPMPAKGTKWPRAEDNVVYRIPQVAATSAKTDDL